MTTQQTIASNEEVCQLNSPSDEEMADLFWLKQLRGKRPGDPGCRRPWAMVGVDLGITFNEPEIYKLMEKRLHLLPIDSVKVQDVELRFDIGPDPYFWDLVVERTRRYFPPVACVGESLGGTNSPFLEWVLEADGQNYMLSTKARVDEYFALATDIPASLLGIPAMIEEALK